jgi:predicted unusual protein kinase regulating ubiquinone biosynthesis (AarF/ABC1/UbiB family)
MAFSLTRGGLVHADMHPGNVRMSADTPDAIVLYDFGNCVEVTPEMRRSFRDVLAAAADRDGRRILQSLQASGLVHLKAGQSQTQVEALLEQGVEGAWMARGQRKRSVAALLQLSGNETPFVMEQEVLGVARGVLHVEGLCRHLVPDADYSQILRWFALQAL